MKFWQSPIIPECKLSQQDLRDISESINQTYAPEEALLLPELVLMPVDPTSLYAYWGLNTENELNLSDEKLILRIFSVPELSEQQNHTQLSFDMTVSGLRNQQKILIPLAATAYSASIGVLNVDESISILATAEPILIPRASPVEQQTKPNLLTTAVVETGEQKSKPKQQIIHDSFAAEDNNGMLCTGMETYTVKNFNNYGYDLEVSLLEGANYAEFSEILKLANIAVATKKSQQSQLLNNNASAQGIIA